MKRQGPVGADRHNALDGRRHVRRTNISPSYSALDSFRTRHGFPFDHRSSTGSTVLLDFIESMSPGEIDDEVIRPPTDRADRLSRAFHQYIEHMKL